MKHDWEFYDDAKYQNYLSWEKTRVILNLKSADWGYYLHISGRDYCDARR